MNSNATCASNIIDKIVWYISGMFVRRTNSGSRIILLRTCFISWDYLRINSNLETTT